MVGDGAVAPVRRRRCPRGLRARLIRVVAPEATPACSPVTRPLCSVPREPAGDLGLERERQERPHRDDHREDADRPVRRADDDRADDVAGHQQLQAEEDRAPDPPARVLVRAITTSRSAQLADVRDERARYRGRSFGTPPERQGARAEAARRARGCGWIRRRRMRTSGVEVGSCGPAVRAGVTGVRDDPGGRVGSFTSGSSTGAEPHHARVQPRTDSAARFSLSSVRSIPASSWVWRLRIRNRSASAIGSGVSTDSNDSVTVVGPSPVSR